MNLLSVDTTAFTVMGYPMSYIELIGTLLYLWSVWLIARRNVLTWPVGIVSVLLYMLLFYQIRLYADTVEQVYYLAASIYGWWHWSRASQTADAQNAQTLDVRYSTPRMIGVIGGITLSLSVIVGAFLTQAHLLSPAFFPELASFPYLDALTTVMSFTAMWLMARKRVESWVYWIIVDVIAIGLYYVKDVRFIALQYVILLIMAVSALIAWHKVSQQTREVAYQP